MTAAEARASVAVLDDFDGYVSTMPCWKRLGPELKVDFFREARTPQELAEYEVIVTIRERTRFTREYVDAARGLRHLALTGRLTGQADLEALAERGIAVSYTDGSATSAAEHTIALLMAATKRIAALDADMRRGGWQIGPATGLAGKTLGVLGLGRIGTQVAQFGKLVGMQVVSWGPTPDQGRSEKYGLKRLALYEVLATCDVLAICLKLSDQTRGLLKARELGFLKKGATLVNTARAEMIDQSDLYDELKKGRINAALDVFHQEPLPKDDLLRALPNVVLTPHMGYVTREVYETFFNQVIDNIQAWKSGRPFKDARSEKI